ncbi:MAG: FHA domain-containing protein [Acidobacteriota bacterium]
MPVPLDQIDSSVIDELMALKGERQLLVERLARMASEREKVTPTVFARVQGDYEARRLSLEKKAAPLKAQARREHAKLRAHRDRVSKAREAALLDREELIFRHGLGEFEDEVFRQSGNALDGLISGHDADLAEISVVNERFLAAFDSEAELSLPVEEPTPPVVVAPPVAAPPAPAVAPVPVVPAVAPEAPAEGSVSDALPARVVVTAPFDVVPPPTLPKEGETMILSAASTATTAPGRLVPSNPEDGFEEVVLLEMTTIGRTPQNTLRVPQSAVSRRHAEIAKTPQGYMLRDLGSENGTFVNGERAQMHLLVEGDRVQVGTARFVYQGR